MAAGAARFKPGIPARENRRAYGRYVGQGHEVPLELPGERDLTPADVDLLRRNFEEAYERAFGWKVPNADVEIQSWVLRLVGDADPAMSGRQPGMPAPRKGSGTSFREESKTDLLASSGVRRLYDGRSSLE